MSSKDRDLLARAKVEIDLPGYLGTHGWVAVPGHDGKRSRCLAGPDGTRIVASLAPDGHWRWFRTDTGKGGSIVDAARDLLGLGSTGQQMAALRRALASPPPPLPPATGTRAPRPVGSTPARPIEARPLDAAGIDYLRSRAVSTATIEAFGHALRSTDQGVQAAHNGHGGEVRGPQVKLFDGGNQDDGDGRGRSLWIATPTSGERPEQIILSESFIDALSAWQMLPAEQRPRTAVASTGGSMCPAGMDKLARAIQRAPNVQVLDASDQGEATTARRTEQIRQAVEAAGASYSRLEPPDGVKDWNDAVRAAAVALAATWLPATDEDEQTQGYSL